MTVASYESLTQALANDFETAIAVPQSASTQYENFPFTPPTNGTWCEFNVLFGREEHTQGGPLHNFRFYGVLQVRIHTKLERGARDGLALADLIANRYRRVTLAGVTFLGCEVFAARRELDSWVTPVHCRFKADREV